MEALGRGALRPYYLLYGEETFLIDRALSLLRRRLLPEGRPGSWRTIWGDEAADRLTEILDEVRAPSLFGGPTIVVVRRAEALREEAQARILATLPLLGDSGCLIMIAATADQRRRLFAACAEAGAAHGFPAPDDATVQAWIGRLAQESGHALAPAAVRELLDRCGAELAVLAGEVEKLALHVGGGGRIEVEHVRAMVGVVRGHAVEALTERLARRDFGGATHCLRQLLADGEPPIRLLAFLAANVRRALHVVELGEQGLTAADIGRRLGMPDWLVGRNLRRGSSAALAHMLHVLRRLDQELKSTRPTDAVFEEALREMVGASAPAPE